MRPLKLRLKGFAGIKAGLGLDEIVLDLSKLPPDARLVALAGPNGVGKSTLLDNLHPYRVMPSRAPGDSPGGFSFYEHLSQSEAVKELVWALDGRTYRSELVFRVNGKRKTDAFLHVEEGGKWTPVRGPNGIVSDGKAETYDACLEHLLGSATTFFASQFAAQGRRALSDYRPGEIKSLLADMLGHASIARLGDRAAETARMLKAGLVSLRAEHRSAVTSRDALAQRCRDLGNVDAALAASVSEKAAAVAAVDTARQALASIEAAREEYARNERRRQELQESIRKLAETHTRTITAIDLQVSRERQRLSELQSTVAQRVTKAREKCLDLALQREQLLAAAASRGRVERALLRLPTCDRVVDARLARCSSIEQELAAARTRLGALRTCESQIASLEREAGQAALRVQDLKKRLGLVDRVPCAGTDLQGRCHLLLDARDAGSMMPSAEAALADLSARRDALRRQLHELGGAAAAVESAERRSRRAQQLLKRSEQRAKAVAVLAARWNEVRQADQMLSALTEEIRQHALIAERGPSAEELAQIQAAQDVLERLERDRSAALQNHEIEHGALERQLAALPALFDESRRHAAVEALRHAETRLAAAEAAHDTAIRRRQHALDLQEQMKAQSEAIASLDLRIRRVEDELSGWTLLARGLSGDGVIALSIDDAGPALASLTNSLLLSCYGPRFAVSIKTQVATAKGELREGFDIVVHDSDTGQSKSVRFMSGGERVWINECLTRAIALYLAQHSGRHYEALFSDESDGPLDAERKRMFMAMKREVLRIGGYAVEFYVSQTPELTAMADHVISVGSLAVGVGDGKDVRG